MSALFLAIGAISAYLLGSIPSSVWIGKFFYGTDVREHGSGNAGATNTLRVLGKKAGITVLILDFLKGFAAASLVYVVPETSQTTELRNIQMLFGCICRAGPCLSCFCTFQRREGNCHIAGCNGGYQLAGIAALHWYFYFCGMG